MKASALAKAKGLSATKLVGRDEQKQLGQFMTPLKIAQLMAQRCCLNDGEKLIRILDPAAGAGILAAAVVEQLISLEHKPTRIEVTLFEIDERLVGALNEVANALHSTCAAVGVELEIRIRNEDFLLSDLSIGSNSFDIVIANPPYFKLNKSDPRSVRHSYAVYGQPNIYGLFMAACARILSPNGRWCFITPRSWTNGPYFLAVRKQILKHLRIEAIHVFESREDHFADDQILQEAMITWAVGCSDHPSMISLSTSDGSSDLASAKHHLFNASEIVKSDRNLTITLPSQFSENAMRTFTARLHTFGIMVSTGPVVAFRAAKHITEITKDEAVPLLWMQHIRHMRVSWPIMKKKEYISANDETAWMLVPNVTMVLMRRFSPKEDDRRIIAAPYIEKSLPGRAIGLENHTNYLYRPTGVLSTDEARGVAAYLNCRLVDQYLRAVAGNTQINATDLRALPLPDLSQLKAIGRSLSEGCSLEEADLVVETVIGTHQLSVAS